MASTRINYRPTKPGISLMAAIVSVAMVMLRLMSRVEAASVYTITPPPFYSILSGDLDVNYSIPSHVQLPDAFISFIPITKDDEEQASIRNLAMPLGKTSSSVRIECGYILKAGKYKLKMYMNLNGQVLAEADLDVRWPLISLSLPVDHQAQTVNVQLWILSEVVTCMPFHNRTHFQVKILRFRSNSTRNKTPTSVRDGHVVGTRDYSTITTLKTRIDLNCQTFDLDGSYQAVLLTINSEPGNDVIVSTSNVMRVTWSGQYQLHYQAGGVFPCSGNTTLVYTHPPCSGDDVIRVYALTRKVEGSMASPLKRTYLAEKKADPAKKEMAFDCGLFIPSASGFCFTYVSVSKSRVYYQQRQLCVPALPNSIIPIEGEWSQWSEWSACTETCGAGKKSRRRLCNNPPPKHGGAFCDGDPYEWRPCSHHCIESIPINPLFSPPIDTDCPCGCTLADHVQGEIIATGRCPGPAVWIIEAGKGWVVSLTFGFFSLNYTRQRVTVRDGPSIYDQLLFSSDDHGYPVEVVSTGSVLRVELRTQFDGPLPKKKNISIEATSAIHSYGFISHYECKAPADDISPAPLLYRYKEKTVMGSTVTVVGIVLCIVVIIVAVVFVICQRTFLRSKVKYTTTSMGGSPAYAIPLTRSEIHLTNHNQTSGRKPRRHSEPAALNSSPHSSSNLSSPGDGIYVDMEKPLTHKRGKGKGKGKGKGDKAKNRKASKSSRTRTPSISSACSQTVKFIKSSISGGNGPLSPKPPTKEYASVKGPYGIEIVDIDIVPEPTRIKSPRLPQPFHRAKNSPTTPSSPSTKMDLLMRKRQEKKSDQSSSQLSDLERVVTGSSDGSSTLRSKTSTTKAQVNWPQSGFVKAALNEVGKSFADRNKRVNQRPPSEEIPLIDSISQESPSHAINIMVKSDSSDSSASGLARIRSSQARRPTSLTESYSSDTTPSSSKAKPIAIEPSPIVSDKFEVGTLKKIDTVRPRPSPTPTSSLTPTSKIQNFPTLPPPSPSSSSRSPRIQRLQQKHPQPLKKQPQSPNKQIRSEGQSPSLSRISHSRENPANEPPKHNSANDPPKNSSCSSLIAAAAGERETFLPRPDGQSPKPLRVETPNLRAHRLEKNNELSSPGKLSKCSSRGSKTTVSSPTRSINTPSEADGLEYDDFIEDDPLSYFDYEDTLKLNFRGVERIGNIRIEEEDDVSQN